MQTNVFPQHTADNFKATLNLVLIHYSGNNSVPYLKAIRAQLQKAVRKAQHQRSEDQYYTHLLPLNLRLIVSKEPIPNLCHTLKQCSQVDSWKIGKMPLQRNKPQCPLKSFSKCEHGILNTTLGGNFTNLVPMVSDHGGEQAAETETGNGFKKQGSPAQHGVRSN